MNQDCCHEDCGYCRSCPEQCFLSEMPTDQQEPNLYDQLGYVFNQWVSQPVSDWLTMVAEFLWQVKR